MALVDSAELLANLLDELLVQHRDGINPTFGQVEDLRDYTALVKTDIRLARAGVGAAGAAPDVAADVPVSAEDVAVGRLVRQVVHQVHVEFGARQMEHVGR